MAHTTVTHRPVDYCDWCATRPSEHYGIWLQHGRQCLYVCAECFNALRPFADLASLGDDAHTFHLNAERRRAMRVRPPHWALKTAPNVH